MKKFPLGPQTLIYPMPTLLVGARVDGKPNFLTVAWAGIANAEPPMISVAIRHSRYTMTGIEENQEFSVNVPSADMVIEADYCGIRSGSKVDKVAACGFKVFYGQLKAAPLIEECPLNLECRVEHILDLGTHALVVGRITETHASADALTDGKPDVEKMKPIIFTASPALQYQVFGDAIARAFSVGRELEKE